MSRHFDVIIVGGGVVGVSTAYHLAKRNLRVLLLEKETLGAKASGGAAGMLAAQEEASSPTPFFEACVASREMFKTLVPEVKEASGVDPEWSVEGVWRVAENEAEAESLLARKAWQERQGLPVEWWAPSQIFHAMKNLAEPFVGALYFPRDGQISSPLWVKALARAAQRAGAVLKENVPHVELSHRNRRLSGVMVHRDKYEAEKIVLAAGAWTPFLASALGFALPLEPVKGQLLILEGFPAFFPGPVFAGRGYFTPKADGRLLVGSTEERVGYSAQITLSSQRRLMDWAARWCPDLNQRAVLGAWAGLRPATVDGWPIMGPVTGWEGLYVCTGHFRNGVLLSPLSGRAMALGIAENRWARLVKAFSLDRFTTGAVPWRS